MTFGRLIRILKRNHISWNPKPMARMAFLLQSSVWSSLFAAIEDFRYGKRLKELSFPSDPVFIIGHWRTGTTYLFKLMSLDTQFTAPTLFQVAEPDSMLVSHSYYKPIMKALVKQTRPMDNVRIGMDEPQEDEYAVYRLLTDSPLEKLVFPSPDRYFLSEWAENNLSLKDEESFREGLSAFFRKLRFSREGTILSKNPFHSLRIKILAEAFPGARFIQIHRNPLCVVPSTMNMWDILMKENALNGRLHKHEAREVCNVMNIMDEKISSAVAVLPEGRYTETRFEELEADPVGTLRQIYHAIGLKFPESLEAKVKDHIASNVNFRKNSFILTEKDRETILSCMGEYMRRHSYS